MAEFVLSWVLPVERAAAVAGDFAEEAETRGGVWFWSSVARTLVAHVVSDFAQRPFALLGAGVRGGLQNALFMAALYAVLFILDVLGHFAGLMVNVAPPGSPPRMELMWQINWATNIVYAIWLFRCGRWAGRTMPGFEVASAVAVGSAGWIAVAAIAIYFHVRVPTAHINPGAVAWHDVPLIVGALMQRRRRVTHGS